MISVQLAKVGNRILEIPPPRIRHAAENHVVGKEIERHWCDCGRIYGRHLIRLRTIEVEGVPVEMSPGKIRSVEKHVVVGQRRAQCKSVIKMLRLPRGILCRLAEK